jgi:glycosyltransferase involved in cell wall biosynthesis
MTPRDGEVLVLIPALDEEPALPGVLASIPRTGDGWRVREVLVVDNGSRDHTAEAARSAGARVIAEPRRGYGAACLAGLAALAAAPPAIVAFMDADRSDDPGDLGALVAPIVAGRADLVIGSRVLGEHEPGSLTVPQRAGNRLATLLLGILFGLPATDLGPFRAVRWEALESLRMRDRDFGWTVEMQARAARAGLRVLEVPVRYRRRLGRSKISGTVRGVIGAGWKILWTLGRVRLGG